MDRGNPPTFERRNLLKVGSGALAAAVGTTVLPIRGTDAAAAVGTDPALPVDTLVEAFGGIVVPPRALERWLCSRRTIRHIACIGDSITQGTFGGSSYLSGSAGSWVDRLMTATGSALGPNLGYGYRGLWLGLERDAEHEWTAVGSWARTKPSDAFDVCPFGDGFYSSGGAGSVLTWTKPKAMTVAGFDLYWFFMPGAGNWQYRVDGGAWTNMAQPRGTADKRLHKFYVSKPVSSRIEIRAYDGSVACLAPIGGIAVYSADPRSAAGVVVHNLGRDEQFLSTFVRPSSGDPFAWIDRTISSPVQLAFRPDLVIVMFSNDVLANDLLSWQSGLKTLVARVAPYADVLLMSPYEQLGRDPVVQATYRAATLAVALERRCGFIDIYEAYAAAGDVGFAAANADGLMYDGLHPSARGHADIAGRVWRLLRTLS